MLVRPRGVGVPGVSPDCHCLCPADIMADKEGVMLSLEEEEEDADVALAYKTPEKKSLREIQELDPGDESLRKYKQALLGNIPVAVGKAGAGYPITPTPRASHRPDTSHRVMQPQRAQGAAVSPSLEASPRGGHVPNASPAGAACAHPTAGRPRHPLLWVMLPGDPGCLGYRITAAVAIGTVTRDRGIHWDGGDGESGRGGAVSAGPLTARGCPCAYVVWAGPGCATGLLTWAHPQRVWAEPRCPAARSPLSSGCAVQPVGARGHPPQEPPALLLRSPRCQPHG